MALLFESVERHATQRATTALVTSLQLLVAREQEFLDLMQSELEVVARERCEDSFAQCVALSVHNPLGPGMLQWRMLQAMCIRPLVAKHSIR